ncbi:UPF0016 domain protein [Aspergillus luchuensis]|uniref:UPF0016 domain protein n=1 Tax=Aspergillus kawachii TaxID=1069201 RepID=A0A146FKV0_ASPKA|nr:UPF0016 domain protein [Aspergillus luchuensis]
MTRVYLQHVAQPLPRIQLHLMEIAGYKAHRPDNPGPPTHNHVRPSRYRTFSAAVPVPMRPHIITPSKSNALLTYRQESL